MSKRSAVSFSTLIKGAQILAPHPGIVSKLISLQLAKWFFPLFNGGADKGRGGRIHQLSIRITDKCNLRCHTCGQWGDNGFLHGKDLSFLKQEEVAPERYNLLFQDIVKNGHRPNVYLWGGEPTMYHGLESVIDGATKLHLPVSIATNGHSLSTYAEHFASQPLFLLQVSVDGHNKDIHNAARPSAGKGDSFNDIVAGIKAVREEKRKCSSKLPILASLTVVSRHNISHLVDIYTMLKDDVDVCVFYLSWWIDEADANRHDGDFMDRFGFNPKRHRGWLGSWKPDTYRELASQLDLLRSLARSVSNPAVNIIPDISSESSLETYYTDHRELFGYRQCISVFQAVELNSNGDMSPCRDYHDYVVGNVKESTITELWNCDNYRSFRKSIRNEGLMPVCSRCCGLMGY